MLNLNCKIRVYQTDGATPNLERKGEVYEFDYANDIQIDSSVKLFTDTAVVRIPKKISVNRLNGTLGFEVQKNLPFTQEVKSIYEYLKQDSFIEIFLGYNGDFKPAFRGYITKVTGDAPVEIHCEDEMHLLKKQKMQVAEKESKYSDDEQNPIAIGPSKSISKEELITLLKDRIEALGIKTEITFDKDLGTLIVDRKLSVVQFLHKLKEDYAIYSFFKLEQEQSKLFITNNPDLYDEQEIEEIDEAELQQQEESSSKFNLLKVPKDLLKKSIGALGLPDIANFFNRNDGFEGISIFKFYYNIIGDNLKVDEKEVKNIRIRAEKFFVNSNTPIQEDFGATTDGELVMTYRIHNNEDELPLDPQEYREEVQKVRADLKNFLKLRFAQIKKSGLTGSFTTFGEPFVRPTDRVVLRDAEDVEKNGTFQVDAVKRSYGLSGYRQEITVGRRVKEKSS